MKGGVSVIPVPSAAMIQENLSFRHDGLGLRLVKAVVAGAGPAQEAEIMERFFPELEMFVASGNAPELLRLVQMCGETQLVFRRHYTRALGRFCSQATAALTKTRCDQWVGAMACLRLLEGVLLCCMTDTEDRPYLCEALQAVLRSRLMPRQAESRLTAACMTLVEPEVRSLYSPDRLSSLTADAIDAALGRLVDSIAATARTEELRQSVFEKFDAVIYQRFGVHGRQFGSAVNGFQLQTSDIDISVLLPTEVQEKLIAEAQEMRERAESGEVDDKDVAAVIPGLPSLEAWRASRPRQQRKAASVAATRALANALRRAGLRVVEVIEAARVPIVKCRHAIEKPPDATRNEATPEEIEFDVDVSFCNEVAYYNSRLLRAYANFDERARRLGILVKLWAKRRKINSPFDGTLSSYSYTLLVIHYLQVRGLLPNLQSPRPEVLALLGKDAPDQRLLEGSNNVWFLDPLDPLGGGADGGGLGSPPGWPPPDDVWLGHKRPDAGLRDLLYGFFRYFALEFNVYANVVSIRLDDSTPAKADHFAALEAEDAELEFEGGDGCEAAVGEQMQAQEQPEDTGSRVETPSLAPTPAPHFPPWELDSSSSEDEDGSDEEGCGELLEPWPSRAPGIVQDVGACGDEENAMTNLVGPNGVGRPETPGAEACDLGEQQNGEDRGGRGRAVRARGATNSSADTELTATEAETAASEEMSRTEEIAQAGSRRTPSPAGMAAPYVGTVKTFNEETGFGFISCQATFQMFQRDVFLHHKQMKAAVGVTVGDRVGFALELNGKGQPQARQVCKLGSAEIGESNGGANSAAPADPAMVRPAGDDGESSHMGTQAAGVGTAAGTADPAGFAANDASDLADHGISAPAASTANVTTLPSGLSFSVQKRIGDRQCLCIDDPMEKNRTLGTSFPGQELLSRELLRAVSCLKRGGEKGLEELFTEQELDKPPPTTRRKEARDFSPIPIQMMVRDGYGVDSFSSIHVQVEKPVKKEMVGRIIGTSGNTIKMLRDKSGLEDGRIYETKGMSLLVLKGSPDSVQEALSIVETIVNGPKKAKNNAAHRDPATVLSTVAVPKGSQPMLGTNSTARGGGLLSVQPGVLHPNSAIASPKYGTQVANAIGADHADRTRSKKNSSPTRSVASPGMVSAAGGAVTTYQLPPATLSIGNLGVDGTVVATAPNRAGSPRSGSKPVASPTTVTPPQGTVVLASASPFAPQQHRNRPNNPGQQPSTQASKPQNPLAQQPSKGNVAADQPASSTAGTTPTGGGALKTMLDQLAGEVQADPKYQGDDALAGPVGGRHRQPPAAFLTASDIEARLFAAAAPNPVVTRGHNAADLENELMSAAAARGHASSSSTAVVRDGQHAADLEKELISNATRGQASASSSALGRDGVGGNSQLPYSAAAIEARARRQELNRIARQARMQESQALDRGGDEGVERTSRKVGRSGNVREAGNVTASTTGESRMRPMGLLEKEFQRKRAAETDAHTGRKHPSASDEGAREGAREGYRERGGEVGGRRAAAELPEEAPRELPREGWRERGAEGSREGASRPPIRVMDHRDFERILIGEATGGAAASSSSSSNCSSSSTLLAQPPARRGGISANLPCALSPIAEQAVDSSSGTAVVGRSPAEGGGISSTTDAMYVAGEGGPAASSSNSSSTLVAQPPRESGGNVADAVWGLGADNPRPSSGAMNEESSLSAQAKKKGKNKISAVLEVSAAASSTSAGVGPPAAAPSANSANPVPTYQWQ